MLPGIAHNLEVMRLRLEGMDMCENCGCELEEEEIIEGEDGELLCEACADEMYESIEWMESVSGLKMGTVVKLTPALAKAAPPGTILTSPLAPKNAAGGYKKIEDDYSGLWTNRNWRFPLPSHLMTMGEYFVFDVPEPEEISTEMKVGALVNMTPELAAAAKIGTVLANPKNRKQLFTKTGSKQGGSWEAEDNYEDGDIRGPYRVVFIGKGVVEPGRVAESRRSRGSSLEECACQDEVTEADLSEKAMSKFKKLVGQLKKKGATSPEGLAAWIGAKKMGKGDVAKGRMKLQKMAVKARKSR